MFDCTPYIAKYHDTPVSPITMTMTILLGFGNILAGIPQAVRLIQKRTPRGVSISTLCLGQFCLLLPIFGHLMSNYPAYVCTAHSGLTAAKVFTVFTPFWNNGTILSIYIVNTICWLHVARGHPEFARPRALAVAANGAIVGATIVIVVAVAACLTRTGPTGAGIAAANVFGICSAVLTSLQWLPQIVATIKNQSAGALSVLMVSLHIVGCVVSIITTVASGNPVSLAANMAIALVFELVLIGLCAFYHIRDRIRGDGKSLLEEEGEKNINSES